MSLQPHVVTHYQSAHPKLWLVKSYLDLITRNDELIYGGGLKQLFVMSMGLSTYNNQDIVDATRKAASMGLLPFGLRGFMVTSILKNCTLYAKLLQEMIEGRIVDIARGDVVNPPTAVKYSADEARRYYYLPPFTFLTRLQKALKEDIYSDSHRTAFPNVTKLEDVATDADFLLMNTQGSEGYNTQQQSSFKSISSLVNSLVNVIDMEASFPEDKQDYKRRARPALKIILYMAKMLMGDLSVRPSRSDLQIVDTVQKINISDGTLAAIPFPTPTTMSNFSYMEEGTGVTLKGRTYLAAASVASFDRRPDSVSSE